MREILFRGKRVYNGEWIYGSYVAGIKKSFIAIEQVYEIIPETIGQYTGLKDKKGNKIFEGDILGCGDKAVEIYFDKEYCQFRARKTTGFNSPIDYYCGYPIKFEIIGNIYDNPELLKDGE